VEIELSSYRAVKAECYKCGEIGHKCRECLLWEKKKRVACAVKPQKAYQQRELVHPVKGKVQERERKLKRTEEKEAAHIAKPQEVQQGWRRSSVKELRKRAEEHYGKDVPEKA